MGQAQAAPPDKRLHEFHADEQQRRSVGEQGLQDHQYTHGDERGTVAQESGPVAQTGYSM
jgi:hypothetical protein